MTLRLALSTLLVLGCNSPRPATDAGSDAPLVLDGGPGTDGNRDGGGGGTDGNDSFAQAVSVTVGMTGVMERIGTPGDHDFFSFAATAGTWYVIDTEANPDDDDTMVDTVITLYDASMTQIAENDDSVPRVNTDSELIWHCPADGTYYLELQEFSDWSPDSTMAEGDPSYTYTLTVNEVDPAAAVVRIDGEPGNDATTAEALRTNMNFGLLLGTFEDASDVDVFTFTVSGTTAWFLDPMPSGMDGYGSTSPAGRVYVMPADESETIARIDNSGDDYTDFSPALPPGDYLLFVEHGGAAAGANDFYAFKIVTGMENTPEGMEASNGTLAGAEALTQMTDADGLVSGFVLAQLGAPSDIDYFSFDLAAGHQMSVACGSASGGSGVRGLRVEVRDASDAVIAMATEAAPMNAFIEDTTASSAGTYYVRLTKTGQDPEVTGTWARCGVRSAVPTTP
jgi:hypothetical protein